MTSPLIHGFLIGGWTLLVAGLLWIAQLVGLGSSFPRYQDGVTFLFVSLALCVNYPHAIWSYRLAYQQGNRFILRNGFSLILVPCLIVAWLVLAVIYWHSPTLRIQPLVSIDKFLQVFGLFTNYSLYSSLGPFIFANLLILQAVTLGKHYVMQSLGVSMSLAYRNKYPITATQRQWLRANLFFLWMVNIIWIYTAFGRLDKMGFEYFAPRVPDILRTASLFGFFVSFIGVLYFIVFANWKRHRSTPPLVAVIPIVSVYIWMQPFWWHFSYQVWVVPLAHCIQYLYFCYYVERGKVAAKSGRAFGKAGFAYLAAIAAVIMVVGYMAFEYVPGSLDSIGSVPFPYFMIVAFNVAINVHHYFIDGVVWSNRSSVTRKHLLLGFQTAP